MKIELIVLLVVLVAFIVVAAVIVGIRSARTTTPLLERGTLANDTVVGFSTRQLFKTVTTPCMRVRRDTDNVEADIGFRDAAVDIDALKAHVGNAVGYVSRWYDQTGSGMDAVQPDTAKQPRVVIEEPMNSNGGKPRVALQWTALGLTPGGTSLIVGNVGGGQGFESFTVVTHAKILSKPNDVLRYVWSKDGSGANVGDNSLVQMRDSGSLYISDVSIPTTVSVPVDPSVEPDKYVTMTVLKDKQDYFGARVDGKEFTRQTGAIAAVTMNTNTDLQIGTVLNGERCSAHMDLDAFMFFAGAKTDDELTILEQSLA